MSADHYHEDEILGKAYDSRLMKRLIHYLRPYRPQVVVSVLLLFLIAALELVGPVVVQRAIEERLPRVTIFPKTHYVASRDTMLGAVDQIEEELELRVKQFKEMDKLLEAQRIQQRTRYDLEMIRELGYCQGVENYSRYLSGRAPGEPPPTLFEYLPDNALIVVDESHVTVPQIGGMYRGDRSRKETLVEYGFRLPSAPTRDHAAVPGGAGEPGDLPASPPGRGSCGPELRAARAAAILRLRDPGYGLARVHCTQCGAPRPVGRAPRSPPRSPGSS